MSEEQKNNVPLIGEIFVEGEAPPQYYQAFLNAQAAAEAAATQAKAAAGQIVVDQEFIETKVFSAGEAANTAAMAARDAAESERNAKDDADRAVGAAGEAEAAKKRAEEVVESAVSYNPQSMSRKQQAQAMENIGVSPYYHTTRDKIEKAHTDEDWAEYIYSQYRAIPGVVEKEVKSDDGTVVSYQYVISTGERSTDGSAVQAFGADSDIKKPKYLLLSGIHGIERNAALSVYRFIRDVLNGRNVPQAFKEGAIIHILPVANPNGFDAFTYENADGVNINRNFTADTKAKETQAIINWLTENSDADLFIDVHNGSALNEIVSIWGDSDIASTEMVKKIALNGVDRIIPYWRDVVAYPSDVEVVTSYTVDNGFYSNIKLGKKPVIFSYCADTKIDSAAFGYASNVLSIPSVLIEVTDYCGDYSDYNPTYDEEQKTATIPQTSATYPSANSKGMIEAVAAGAEAIGNILLEFYEQSLASEVVDDMKVIDRKLDTLLVANSFRIERGNSCDYDSTNKVITIPCSPKPKFVLFRATDETQAAIVAKANAEKDGNKYYFCGGMYQSLKDFDTASAYPTLNQNSAAHLIQYYAPYSTALPTIGTTTFVDSETATTLGTASKTFVEQIDETPAEYEWAAYYWDE